VVAVRCGHDLDSGVQERGESVAYVSKMLGHSRVSMTLDHYAHCLPDTARERGADLLVSELLAGTNAGTSALPERPGASTSVAGDAVEMPRKSRNVRERQGASATATEELRA